MFISLLSVLASIHMGPASLRLPSINSPAVLCWPAKPHSVNVYIFITHDCPIANHYSAEIGRIEATYASKKIHFYEVYSEADLKLTQAKKHHHDFRLKGSGLLDAKGRLARILKAHISPEVVVLSGPSTKLYQGRIDNTYAAVGLRRAKPTTHELRDVLEAISHSQEVTTKPAPDLGCTLILPEH